MADAAYQTVQTLQGMLDSKIEMIRKKESIIAELKGQMQQQRRVDLDEIASLRKRLADTGETTLSKMHEIVAKANAEAPMRSAQNARPSSKYDAMKGKDIETALNQKDQVIRRLEADKTKYMQMHNEAQGKARTLKSDNDRLETKLLDTDQKQMILSQKELIGKLKKDLAARKLRQTQLDKAI
jgi:hypothetical protein